VNIGLLSCSRLPTKREVSGGLGKSAYDIAAGLAQRGHDLTLYGATGSVFEHGELVTVRDEMELIDRAAAGAHEVYFDYSHSHGLSEIHDGLKVVNCIGDRETRYTPKNAVVASHYMQRLYSTAKVIYTGIDVSMIPYHPEHDGYLVFMARMNFQKGWDKAVHVSALTGLQVHFIGPGGYGYGLDNYHGALHGMDKWDLLGGALAMLAPYEGDASPRTPLEAAACGVPTICLEGDGTSEHVIGGLTGYICEDARDMAEHVKPVKKLERQKIREWVEGNHSLTGSVELHERLLQQVAAGMEW